MLAALQQYDWPGNVRELKNTIERAVVLSNGPVITARAVSVLGAVTPQNTGLPSLKLRANIEWVEKETIRRALESARGVKKDAAEMMGISQRALSYYLAQIPHRLSGTLTCRETGYDRRKRRLTGGKNMRRKSRAPSHVRVAPRLPSPLEHLRPTSGRHMRHLHPTVLTITALAAGAAACDEKLSNIAGPTPNLEPTFSSIQANIFETTDSSGRTACVNCHTNRGRIPAGQLNLLHDAAYDQLVNRASSEQTNLNRVTPTIRTQLSRAKARRHGRHHRRPHAAKRTAIPHPGPDRHRPPVDRARRAAQLMFTTMKETSVIRSSIRCRPAVLVSAVGSARRRRSPKDDAELKLAEPDFTLVALPTALRLPNSAARFA